MTKLLTSSNILRGGEFAFGAYLAAPGLEDAATGGLTLAPSFLLGLGMMAHAAGWKPI